LTPNSDAEIADILQRTAPALQNRTSNSLSLCARDNLPVGYAQFVRERCWTWKHDWMEQFEGRQCRNCDAFKHGAMRAETLRTLRFGSPLYLALHHARRDPTES
jgi:hypothetical protein